MRLLIRAAQITNNKLQWHTKSTKSIVERDNDDPELRQDAAVNHTSSADLVRTSVNKHHYRVPLPGTRFLRQIDYIAAALDIATDKLKCSLQPFCCIHVKEDGV